jgi:hypothetical protein
MKTCTKLKTCKPNSRVFNRKPRIAIGLAIVAAGSVAFAQNTTDFCLKTAQDALQACQDVAESARAIALGKCENISDPAARSKCEQQAAQGFQDAQQTCQAGFSVRQTACQKLGPARYDPVINPANFVRYVTNTFFPLPPGTTFVYEGQTVDGFIHNDFIVTKQIKVILGVTCTEVHDLVYLDGKLAEDTLDWYAQDKQGNVWYFGESTAELVNGRVVTVKGSFKAGVNRDKPGIIMEAHPMPGDFYRQEFSLGNAEDYAQVVNLNSTVTVPAGTCHNCLKTLETTPLEPDAQEVKYYAAGFNNVLTVDLNTGDKIKLIKVITN